MRARIKQVPNENVEMWDVEIKNWYQFRWTVVASCSGTTAKERAMKLAEKCLFPQVIEVKKTYYC